MRLGVIDLGTNSVRFDVHQIAPDGSLERLHREKLMIRLGQGAFVSGKLDRAAIRRALQAFERFHRIGATLRTDKVIAFGTSALREVADRDRFLQLVKDRTGIEVRVISGAEEAKLIALGVLTNERVGSGRFGLIDIGGGSTEISICRGRVATHSFSFPLGTARLQQTYLPKSPPSAKAMEELREHLRSTLLARAQLEAWPRVGKLYGSSGTVRAVAKLLRAKSLKRNTIERGKLKAMNEAMSTLTPRQLEQLPGMEPKRVDMILAGSILLEEAMKALGAKKVNATEYSLRDGILEEEMKLLRQGKTSHLALHIKDLYRIARDFGRDEAQLKRMVKLGTDLFVALRPVHKLRPGWQTLLTATLILKNVGERISLANYPRHSYYIIKNGDLPPLEEWESEFIALLCLHQKGGKLVPSEISFWKDKARRNAFLKLLALVRLLDALDPGPDARVSLRGVRLSRGCVTLALSGRAAAGFESLEMDRRTNLFRKVFRKTVVAGRR